MIASYCGLPDIPDEKILSSSMPASEKAPKGEYGAKERAGVL